MFKISNVVIELTLCCVVCLFIMKASNHNFIAQGELKSMNNAARTKLCLFYAAGGVVLVKGKECKDNE